MIPAVLKVPLAQVTTLNLGGPARFYIAVKELEELRQALLFCKKEKTPFFILGKGSNCLFEDRGFNGCVIHNKIDGLERLQSGRYKAFAGYSFSLLGAQTAKEGYSGLEFASGIPASVGGAIYMNAGANECETKDSLESVELVDSNGDLKLLKKTEIIFNYRYSSFQSFPCVIISGTFALQPSPQARATQIEIVKYRSKTQPYNSKSAGCIFKNPEGCSAGKLIDSCQLKSFRIGQAEVSGLHANFLVNAGQATSSDFKRLISYVQSKVQGQTGIYMEVEVRIIPYEINS